MSDFSKSDKIFPKILFIRNIVLFSLRKFKKICKNKNFVLFKPCSIVSGDFYWLRQVKNYVIIVAADCTGHGIPGAFMSMLGISYLNELINRSRFDILLLGIKV